MNLGKGNVVHNLHSQVMAVTTYQTQRASYQLTYFSQSQGMWFAFSADSDKVSLSFDQLQQFKGVWSSFLITQTKFASTLSYPSSTDTGELVQRDG